MDGAANPPVTREAWLHQAIDAFRPRFESIGMPLPDRLHVSVGFGYGARRENAVILGQCWARRASADEVNHIFVSPQQDDPAAMLVTLLHELIHAADDCAHGHKGAFAKAATALGFRPPMTTTPPSAALAVEMASLAEHLGPLPHAKLTPTMTVAPKPPAPDTTDGGTVPIHSGPGKQSTRLIKLVAECCGYTVRTTARWLAQGNPLCPHGDPMTRQDRLNGAICTPGGGSRSHHIRTVARTESTMTKPAQVSGTTSGRLVTGRHRCIQRRS